MRSTGPSPTTWYATEMCCPTRAYLVSGLPFIDRTSSVAGGMAASDPSLDWLASLRPLALRESLAPSPSYEGPGRSASHNIPTSTARRSGSSSQSISSSAKVLQSLMCVGTSAQRVRFLG